MASRTSARASATVISVVDIATSDFQHIPAQRAVTKRRQLSRTDADGDCPA
jgi:hypothetical protein